MEMNFYDTSFFRSNSSSSQLPQLPSPASILQQYAHQGASVVKYAYLSLAVKFGDACYLRIEEAQTMRALRQVFVHGEVPVPEVFGWKRYGDQNFIYVSLIAGLTLREAWPLLDDKDKARICDDLSCINQSLRRLKQIPSHPFIGSVNGRTVQDRFFKLDYEKGPFSTIASFNDWLLAAATRQKPEAGVIITGPLREYLPDEGEIYFTHGDLTLGNIIISDVLGSWGIVGVVDWEQAGWYPEYWEYCKLLYGVEYSHEWRNDGWADTVINPFGQEWEVFAEYSSWRCP
ncbi:hypothetical protein QQS21_010860 [Conoideocrella luteorostrata]|uniref:Aminoglycoside phosphotransferase domain-containing protein n=1 Tax=Conoideocrella luteorostrata TaxID=1105319 RepID=A0AAJ0CEE0_9HYPO|nr:hypothetical protein QQS21_010860 [Conoideocrella luteorostrata]